MTTAEWIGDIQALLAEADAQIVALKRFHDDALNDPNARRPFKAKIKNVLENQRSALDYLAVGVTEQVGTPKGLIYYPLAQSPSEFPTLFEAKMPGVAVANKHVMAAIERHQPYSPNHEWLRHLNQLTREQKHNRFTQQLVREVYQCRVTEKNSGASVIWEGLRFRPGRMESVGGSIGVWPEPGRPADAPKLIEFAGPTGVLVFGVPINPITQRPFPSERLEVESGPIHQWCFVNPHQPVLYQLAGFQSGVASVVNDALDALSG